MPAATPDPQAERLGRAIMTARTAQKLSRRDLAAAAVLSYPYVAELENGLKTPSARALEKIAGALHLTAAELLSQRDLLPPGRGDAAVETQPAVRSRLAQPFVGAVVGAALAAPAARASAGRDTVVERLVDRVMAEVEQSVRESLDAIRRELPAMVRAELRREVDNS